MPRQTQKPQNQTQSTTTTTSSSPSRNNDEEVAQPTQRRSVRLMKRQRDCDGDGEGEKEEEEGEEDKKSKIKREESIETFTRSTEEAPTTTTTTTSTSTSTSTLTTAASSSSSTSSNTTNSSLRSTSNTTNSSLRPTSNNNTPIVFSIGISRTQPSTSSPIPPDIHWIFNTGTNPSPEELQDLIRNSSSSSRIRSTSFVIPLTGVVSSSAIRTSANVSESNDSFTSPPAFNPLNFARQMFQLMSSIRSSPAAPTENNEIEAPFREFLANITNLTNTSSSSSGGQNSPSDPSIFRLPEGSISTDDMESLLNDFISRIFGGMDSTPQGLTPERINSLPPLDLGSEFDCAICRETAKAGEEKCVKLPCDHSFHFDCIEPWLKRVSSCPICRSVIKE